jgi:D-alanyl-D-alanine carboxypeptidase/D-alanyl-D-alanine-endopeptidase (penicillin-binding protein 4)
MHGLVYAKSGSMSGVLGYSGYIKGNNGEWYSYAVIVNNFPEEIKRMRPALHKILEALFEKVT